MYTKIKIHNELIKEIRANASDIGLSDLASQISYLIRRGILQEQNNINTFNQEYTSRVTSRTLVQSQLTLAQLQK